MEPPDPALDRRIADVRALAAERGREHARLVQLDHDLDERVSAASRSKHLAAAGVAFLLALAVMAIRGISPTPRMAAVATVTALVVIVLVLLRERRRIRANAFNRRFAAVFVLAVVALLVHRLVNLVVLQPVDVMLTNDLLVLAAVSGTATIAMSPRMWPVPMLLVVGTALTRVWPGAAFYVFGTTVSVAVLTAAFLFSRSASPRPSR
jgi:hypothetical protein